MTIDRRIGFLGFGNMGEAIARGLITSGTCAADHVLAYDVDSEKLARLADIEGQPVESASALAKASDILVLAPKPQDMQAVLESIEADFKPSTLLISIAAGISISYIQGALGEDTRVVRVMPNTPALVSAGAAGVAPSDNCSDEDAGVALRIFEAIGIAERLPESAIDAVTALSGSGPAYYFYLAECCVKAGVKLGLSEDQATNLAAETLYGAGKLLKESVESASELRERVTSKGGTTAAALDVFRERDLEATVYAAMKAAADRSGELGQ